MTDSLRQFGAEARESATPEPQRTKRRWMFVLPSVKGRTLGLYLKMGGGKSCSSGDKTPAQRSDYKGGPDGAA